MPRFKPKWVSAPFPLHIVISVYRLWPSLPPRPTLLESINSKVFVSQFNLMRAGQVRWDMTKCRENNTKEKKVIKQFEQQ